MASKPVAKLVIKTFPGTNAERIASLKREATRYPYSPVFQETIALLEQQQPKPVEERVVSIDMPKDTAEKLYGLLGQITRHSGFNDLFASLDTAGFAITRQRPKLHFVRDNVVEAEF